MTYGGYAIFVLYVGVEAKLRRSENFLYDLVQELFVARHQFFQIASRHLIRVMIKATSPPHLRLQDLDQLSGLKGVKMISNIYFIGSVTL